MIEHESAHVFNGHEMYAATAVGIAAVAAKVFLLLVLSNFDETSMLAEVVRTNVGKALLHDNQTGASFHQDG